MKSIFVENIAKVKRAIPKIESKIKIKLNYNKGVVTIKGAELNEFLAVKILRAVDFGFDVEDALLLVNENFNLEFINIKEHTRRRNLEEIRSRIVGRKGKAKKTIEGLTGGIIILHNNIVGLIVDSDHLEAAIQAIISLIRGAKHGNVFSYLEKENIKLKKIDEEDLGLKKEFE